MDSSWNDFDLPVLRAAIEYLDDNPSMRPNGRDLARLSGLDLADVGKSMRRLNGAYLRTEGSLAGTPETTNVMEVYPDARRAAGQWPTADNLADRVVAALRELAENAPSEEERSRARKLLDGASGVGKGVLTEVIAKVVTGGMG